jgi:type I restriction enzyme R subunit
MDAGQLYDPPFTDTAPQGPDQVFEMDHLRRLVTVISDIDATADNVTA